MTKIQDFMSMSPSKFYSSKWDEDPQKFVDKVYKVLATMNVSSKEKVKLATY